MYGYGVIDQGNGLTVPKVNSRLLHKPAPIWGGRKGELAQDEKGFELCSGTATVILDESAYGRGKRQSQARREGYANATAWSQKCNPSR